VQYYILIVNILLIVRYLCKYLYALFYRVVHSYWSHLHCLHFISSCGWRCMLTYTWTSRKVCCCFSCKVHIWHLCYIYLCCDFQLCINKYDMMIMPVYRNEHIIIRSHGSTTYVDAAHCYRPSSMVCRSVTLVSPAKKCWTSRDAIWLRTRGGPGNHVLDGVQIPRGNGQFLGGKGACNLPYFPVYKPWPFFKNFRVAAYIAVRLMCGRFQKSHALHTACYGVPWSALDHDQFTHSTPQALTVSAAMWPPLPTVSLSLSLSVYAWCLIPMAVNCTAVHGGRLLQHGEVELLTLKPAP